MRYSSLAMLVACSLATSAAHADFNNTITFEGEVTDQTCKVDVNGSDKTTVKLPVVSEQSMQSLNATAGETPFTVNITECAKEGNVSLRISRESVNEKGHIKIDDTTSSAAKGYAVQLIDQDKEIPLETETHTLYALGTTTKTGDATFSIQKEFIARYIREDNDAKAGIVKAVVKYELAYQ